MSFTITVPADRANALRRLVKEVQERNVPVSQDDQFAVLELATQMQFADRRPKDPTEQLRIDWRTFTEIGDAIAGWFDTIDKSDNPEFLAPRSAVEGLATVMNTIVAGYGPCDHAVGICCCDLRHVLDSLNNLLRLPSPEPAYDLLLEEPKAE